MKLNFKGIILSFLVLGLSSFALKAQDWELGAAIGASGYMGENNPEKIYKFNSLSGTLGAKYIINPTWGIRGTFSILKIQNDSLSSSLSGFNKNLFEASVLAEFNFFKFKPNKSKNAYTPYVFAGLGGVAFEYKRSYYSSSIVGRPVIPIGVGFKYNLKGNWNLDTHLTYRLANTDVLDDNSGGRQWVKGIYNNINYTDSYMAFQIGFTYTFFYKGECPTW